ncbi:MAG TPA: arabinan endo-1,5-alpha-L-arabinosidase, partial [Polyangiaceae bacterium]
MTHNHAAHVTTSLGLLLVVACGTKHDVAAGTDSLGGSSATSSGTVTTTSAGGGSSSSRSQGGTATVISSNVANAANGGASQATATGGSNSAATSASGDSTRGGTGYGGAGYGGTSNRSTVTSSGGTAAWTGGAGVGGTRAAGGASATIPSGGTGPISGGAAGAGASARAGNTSVAGSSSQLCDAGVWDGVKKPVPLTLTGNLAAHDPTMIASNGVYYRYWTGDGILSAKSTNLTNWTNAASIYKNGYSAWTKEWLAKISGETFNFPWAPDVSYFNGQYHIYAAFSAKFGDNISCINHLTTSDLAAGDWVDHGTVICTSGSENYNAIDADIGFDASGMPFMAFGSFWDGIMATALNADGTRSGTTLTRLASASQIEAPVLFYRCGYYYLFVSFGLCCPGENRTIAQLSYRVVVGRSKSILGPYVDRSGKSMLDGGGTLMVQGDHVTYAAAGHSDVMVSGNTIYHL